MQVGHDYTVFHAVADRFESTKNRLNLRAVRIDERNGELDAGRTRFVLRCLNQIGVFCFRPAWFCS